MHLRRLFFCVTIAFFSLLGNAGSVVKLSSSCFSHEIINFLASIRKTLSNKFPVVYDEKNREILSSGFRPLEYINEPVLVFLDSENDLRNVVNTEELSLTAQKKGNKIYEIIEEAA